MSTPQQTSLWSELVKWMRHSGVTAEPWGQDAGRVRWLFFETYLLGERPTRGEMAAVAGASQWGREVTRLWAERLRNPRRRPGESASWLYPFAVPHGIVHELGLEPLDTRLARALCDAAVAYAEGVAQNEPDEKLEDVLRLQTCALRVWGQTVAITRGSSEDVSGHVALARRRSLVTAVPH